MKRTLTLVVLVAWVVMVGLLLRKQTGAPALELPAAPDDADAVSGRDEWFGIYQGGAKIGHAHRVTAPATGGHRFYEDSVVALAMLGVPQTLHTSLVAETDERFALRRFRFTLVSPATEFGASGGVEGGELAVTYGPKGQTAALRVPLDAPIYLASTLRPRVLAGETTPGTRYTVPVFNPLTLHSEPMTVTIEGRETLAGRDGPVETIRLAEEHQGIRARAWVTSGGAVIREEAALGFMLERETATHALEAATTDAPVDLTAVSRIPLTGAIDDPRGLTHLSLRVQGPAAPSIPDDPPRQRVHGDRLRIEREDAPAPIALAALGGTPEDRAPAPFIEADDPAVVAQARRIVGDARDAGVAARRLVAWVSAHVEKAPSITVPSAREVLASLRGDCNEHAVLLTALARAAGIPARVVAGAVYAGDGFYYHAWSELWLGRWISADSVFDQMPVDATHVKLLAGGPERHLALAGVVGNLQFTREEDER